MVSNLPGIARGIPSHDTFGDVFARLDPTQFQNCFVSWTQAIAQLLPGEVVAIDGKTVLRPGGEQGGHAYGQRLGDAEHPDLGSGQD